MRTLLSLMLVAACGHLAAAAELTTPWDATPSATTPRYAETVAWCRQLADAHPTVALTTFGRSPEERDLPLVIWDADGLRDPAAVHAAGRTVVLIQACIHAGESCGKDAGMTLVRDLAELGGPADLCVLFIPIFNVDGHERFGPYNRVNQNGPREMGWRVTAQNLNLNRDFLKADAPEMRAWLALWNAWSPHFLVDIHSTDGADYQYAISYGLELHGNLDAGLTGWLTGYLGAMEAAMAADGLPLVPYVSFRRWHDPAAAWRAGWPDPASARATPRCATGPACSSRPTCSSPTPCGWRRPGRCSTTPWPTRGRRARTAGPGRGRRSPCHVVGVPGRAAAAALGAAGHGRLPSDPFLGIPTRRSPAN
ncbi:MAG: M14 family zinc carboxypeptidase [Candidatus Krumholzibacteriia bacterium]